MNAPTCRPRPRTGVCGPGAAHAEGIAKRDAQIVELHAGGATIADIIRDVRCARDTAVKVLRAAGRR